MQGKYIVLSMILLVFISQATSYSSKIDKKLLENNEEYIDVLVEFSGEDHSFREKGAEKFALENIYKMRISKPEIYEMSRMKSVKKIWAEREYKILLDVSVPAVNNTLFLKNGYNGTGIRVCILDTGINATNAALSPRVINSSNFTENTADDLHGHGTHVAGIVASSDSTYSGVAPGAYLLNAKVCSKFGICYDTDIMKGIDWCIANGADILSLSLGATETPNDGSDPLSQYADLAVGKGKVVVVSAGNDGPGNSTISCPGCAHKVITVGSAQTGKGLTTKGLISSFSSRGPTADNRTKPDVTAPGQPITSLGKAGGFVSLSGTSMSAPHVSGLAALILQARNMSADEIKALLMNTADGLNGKDNTYGAGRINATKVFEEMNNTIKGSIRNSSRAHNIFVLNNSELRVTLYWPENYTAHSNLDAYILDPSGSVINSSNSVYNTDESAKTKITQSGYWKVLVTSAGASQNYSVAANYPISEQFFFISNSTNQTVFHNINVTNPSQLKTNIDWNSQHNLDLYIYNTSGFLVASSTSEINNENATVNNAEMGMWTIKINAAPANTTIPYSITANNDIFTQMYDNAAPSISIMSPRNGANITNSSLNVAFEISDDMNLRAGCRRTLDNETAGLGNLTVNANNSFVVNISDGFHNLGVGCADTTGKEGEANISFFADATPPDVTFASIDANNSFVRRNHTFINLTATDSSGTGSCVMLWDNTTFLMAEYTTANSTICYINRTGVEGSYVYSVLVNDTFGNTRNETRTITFDTTRPYINNYSPANNSLIKGSGNDAFSVNYTETNLDRIELYWRNGTTNFTRINLTGCSSGSNVCSTHLNLSSFNDNSSIQFYFAVYDRSDLSFTLGNYTAAIDRTNPEISFIGKTPQNNAHVLQNRVEINVSIADLSLDSCSLEFNGENESMSKINPGCFRQMDDIKDGTYTFRVYANDSAGNRNASEMRTITVNATGSVINFLTALNQTLANGLKVINSAGAEENFTNLIIHKNYTLQFVGNVFVEMEGFALSSLNTTTFTNITNNLASEKNISNSFNSTGGILDSYVWVDLNDLLPLDNFTAKIMFQRVYTIYFYLNGTRDSPDITRVTNVCNTAFNNAPCFNTTRNSSVLYLPSFSGGAGGNDTQAPSLTVSSPVSAAYSSSSVTLAYTVSDNVAVDKCWYILNSGSNTTLAGCTNTTIAASQGSNTLIVYANDTSNNINQSAITFAFAPPAPPAASGGGGGGGGGSSLGPLIQAKKNQMNTAAIETAPAISQPSINRTANQATEVPSAKNETITSETTQANQTAGASPTGLVTVSPANFIIGGIVIAIIIAALLLWKFRPIRKRAKKKS